ncbi:MAG: tRNA-dihydrouridine synthase, partial [Candidatus Sericytochromatia bacterium]
LKRTAHYLNTGELLPPPSDEERMAVAVAHVRTLIATKGERIGVSESRKHVAWYTTGMRGSAELRKQVNQTRSAEELLALLTGYLSLAAA